MGRITSSETGEMYSIHLKCMGIHLFYTIHRFSYIDLYSLIYLHTFFCVFLTLKSVLINFFVCWYILIHLHTFFFVFLTLKNILSNFYFMSIHLIHLHTFFCVPYIKKFLLHLKCMVTFFVHLIKKNIGIHSHDLGLQNS